MFNIYPALVVVLYAVKEWYITFQLKRFIYWTENQTVVLVKYIIDIKWNKSNPLLINIKQVCVT
jgi:hypothetical protein